MNETDKNIQEPLISKISSQLEEYDCGVLRTLNQEEKEIPEYEYASRNISAYLLYRGYSLMKVKGLDEELFFVADQENNGHLKQDLIKLGRKFDQDSVLFIPHRNPGVLVGTSKREGLEPKYECEETIGRPDVTQENVQFFSPIKGQVISFELIKEMNVPGTINGKWAMSLIAKKLFEDSDN